MKNLPYFKWIALKLYEKSWFLSKIVIEFHCILNFVKTSSKCDCFAKILKFLEKSEGSDIKPHNTIEFLINLVILNKGPSTNFTTCLNSQFYNAISRKLLKFRPQRTDYNQHLCNNYYFPHIGRKSWQFSRKCSFLNFSQYFHNLIMLIQNFGKLPQIAVPVTIVNYCPDPKTGPQTFAGPRNQKFRII